MLFETGTKRQDGGRSCAFSPDGHEYRSPTLRVLQEEQPTARDGTEAWNVRP